MLASFAEKVHLVCLAYGGSVTSWIRSKDRNNKVKGHVRSLHLVGLACDVVLDEMALASSALSFAKRLGLHGIIERDHIHLQALPSLGEE